MVSQVLTKWSTTFGIFLRAQRHLHLQAAAYVLETALRYVSCLLSSPLPRPFALLSALRSAIFQTRYTRFTLSLAYECFVPLTIVCSGYDVCRLAYRCAALTDLPRFAHSLNFLYMKISCYFYAPNSATTMRSKRFFS